jgi:hypothetical protein
MPASKTRDTFFYFCHSPTVETIDSIQSVPREKTLGEMMRGSKENVRLIEKDNNEGRPIKEGMGSLKGRVSSQRNSTNLLSDKYEKGALGSELYKMCDEPGEFVGL